MTDVHDTEGVYYKCSCTKCGQEIEYPADMSGSPVDCPSCNEALTLPKVESISDERSPASKPSLSVKGKSRKRMFLISLFVLALVVALTAICFRLYSIHKRPHNARDGSVKVVKEFLNDYLNDPYSVKYVKWSEVEKHDDFYSVSCTFRCKNAFGAYMLVVYNFLMESREGEWRVTRIVDSSTGKQVHPAVDTVAQSQETVEKVAERARATVQRVYNALPAYELDVKTLYEAFNENEIAANERYKGKLIDITGKIEKVKEDSWNSSVDVSLGSGWATVSCSFPFYDTSIMAGLTKGMTTVIRGECVGKKIYPTLDHCVVMKLCRDGTWYLCSYGEEGEPK